MCHHTAIISLITFRASLPSSLLRCAGCRWGATGLFTQPDWVFSRGGSLLDHRLGIRPRRRCCTEMTPPSLRHAISSYLTICSYWNLQVTVFSFSLYKEMWNKIFLHNNEQVKTVWMQNVKTQHYILTLHYITKCVLHSWLSKILNSEILCSGVIGFLGLMMSLRRKRSGGAVMVTSSSVCKWPVYIWMNCGVFLPNLCWWCVRCCCYLCFICVTAACKSNCPFGTIKFPWTLNKIPHFKK